MRTALTLKHVSYRLTAPFRIARGVRTTSEGWHLATGFDRDRLCKARAPGAARNALDCALRDLQAQREGRSVAALLGQPEPLPPLASAQTVRLESTPATRPHRSARCAACCPRRA